jgi:ArsR family transcriptional regulator, arsenate/arsenite/antimonite-responsive transcriptional repressor
MGYHTLVSSEKGTKAEETRCCLPVPPGCERRFEGIAEAARLFRVLGDETRLAILKQLRDRGEVCACDFLACCDLAQPTISHHLKVLRDAGLVNAIKRGLWVHYTLNKEKLETLRSLLP